MLQEHEWGSVVLGRYPTNVALASALHDRGYKPSGVEHSNILDREFQCTDAGASIRLLTPTVADLGFPKEVTNEQLTNALPSLGISACPLEVPALLLIERAKNTIMEAVMNPEEIFDFRVERRKGINLNPINIYPGVWIRVLVTSLGKIGNQPSLVYICHGSGQFWLHYEHLGPHRKFKARDRLVVQRLS